MNIKAIDLFCGIGGLTKGVEDSGINVVLGIDSDETCRYAYERNTKAVFWGKSIEDVSGEDLSKYYAESEIKILMGCAPCQPFSNYSLKYIKRGIKDDKWNLLRHFLRLVREIKPDIITMENVPQLCTKKVFQEFVAGIKSYGYEASYSIVSCTDYGVPQKRNRLVFFASLHGRISIIPPTHKKPITVKETIAGMESLKNGDVSSKDPVHRCSKLSTLNLKRIKQSTPGGTWEDWTEDLVLSCHKKSTGIGYKAVYGRMEWDKPAPTITTQFYGYGNGRFGHPEQDRAISLREGALLQSFPPNYDFGLHDGTYKMCTIGTHIGNAVPVKLGDAIGKSMLLHLDKVRWRNDYY